MTEAEWRACTEPGPMLEALRGKASDRKLRLVACALTRRVLPLLPEPACRRAVEAAEQYADGALDKQAYLGVVHAFDGMFSERQSPCANAEAWRRFCCELDIAADALTAANHPGWFLPFCEERMPAQAPTAEVAQARLRKAGWEVSQLVTAESLLARWRSRLRAMTRHAPPDNGKGEP